MMDSSQRLLRAWMIRYRVWLSNSNLASLALGGKGAGSGVSAVLCEHGGV